MSEIRPFQLLTPPALKDANSALLNNLAVKYKDPSSPNSSDSPVESENRRLASLMTNYFDACNTVLEKIPDKHRTFLLGAAASNIAFGLVDGSVTEDGAKSLIAKVIPESHDLLPIVHEISLAAEERRRTLSNLEPLPIDGIMSRINKMYNDIDAVKIRGNIQLVDDLINKYFSGDKLLGHYIYSFANPADILKNFPGTHKMFDLNQMKRNGNRPVITLSCPKDKQQQFANQLKKFSRELNDKQCLRAAVAFDDGMIIIF